MRFVQIDAVPMILKCLPSEEDKMLALESGRVLAALQWTETSAQRVDFYDHDGTCHSVNVPTSALHLLLGVLNELGQGNGVSVAPTEVELTTQEAADLLSISRPLLIQLLEKGELPFRMAGSHRRIRYHDVIAYRSCVEAERSNGSMLIKQLDHRQKTTKS